MKVNTKNQKAVAEAYAALDAKAGKDAAKMITESWAPMITRTTGVQDADKLEWMSQLAHNTAKGLNEAAMPMEANAYSQFGGVYSPYNTLYNTLGVGNVVPAGKPAMTGADFADNTALGSGDKFPALLPLALKVAAKTIGFELVNTTPLAGPSGVLPYMDYVYAGSKQPFGATPAWNKATANPEGAFSVYGLPHAFKAALVLEEGKSMLAKKAELIKAGLGAGCRFESEDGLAVEFVGWSRIDGDPMFKVVDGKKSLGDYFAAGTLELEHKGESVVTRNGVDSSVYEIARHTVDASIAGMSIELAGPKLISMLEDQLQGFAGAGEHDSDAWYGTYQDGTVLYDPMSRAQGEMTAPREISLQLFTKNVTVGTIQVACAVTQEQVTDLQKQWGIDVVKIVENAAINELSTTINKHITSRLFALGWKNQVKLVEVEGPEANLNLSFTPVKEGAALPMTPAFAIPEGSMKDGDMDYVNYRNVALPFRPFVVNAGAAFENRQTLIKRIFTNILAASNWIQQRGRQGAATFVVTNITVATLLQSEAHGSFSPIENSVSQSAGQLYPIGKVCGLTVYVDPLMAAYDTRVLVGRKGGKDEPGVHFCPYVMAEVVRTIAEGTMAPKLMVKSRYALVDAGFFPETQYLTFCVNTRGL